MTVQIIKATIESVNRKISKTGDPGLSIVLKYDDGSEWGKKIYQWLWFGDSLRENQKDDIKAWAALAEPGCDLDTAKQIIAGESWVIFGTIVDLQVNQEDERFWKIINFGPEESLHQVVQPFRGDVDPLDECPNENEIPF